MPLHSFLFSPAMTRALRWFARFLGTLLAVLFVAFWLSENRFIALRVSLADALQLVCIIITFIGLIIAWRHEMVGGLAILGGMGLFFLLEWRQRGTLPVGLGYKLAILVGLLFLVIWWHERRTNRYVESEN